MCPNFDLILNDFPKVNLSKDKPLVLFSGGQYRLNRYLHSFLARALAEAKIPSAFLDITHSVEKLLPKVKSPDGPISQILDRKNYFFHYTSIDNDLGENINLDVNLNKNKISYKNLNFYHVIKASLARDKRCYSVDLEHPYIQVNLNRALLSLKRILAIAERLEHVSKNIVDKIYIVGKDPNYIPNGIFLRWAQHFNTINKIEFISISRGYIHYFGDYNRDNWFRCKNLTTKGLVNAAHITKKEFQEHQNKSNPQTRMNRTDDFIKKALNPDKYNIKENKLPKKLLKWQSSNEQIICLFTNLLYDRPVKDFTEVFSGMKDWLSKSIRIFKKRNQPLIIKPHPAEANPVRAGHFPAETISDLINPDLNYDNLLLLKPDRFSTQQLMSHLDLGLVWRSSAALEIAYNNIPTIVCGPVHWQEHIQFPMPESLTDYKNLIQSLPKTKPSEKLKQRIADFITYRYDNLIHFPYLDAESFNWKEDLITDFLEGKEKPKVMEKLLSEMNLKSK